MITLTLNPCVDKTVSVEEFAPYGLNRIKNSRLDIGGKGINVARVLKSSGENVRVCGILGSENSEGFDEFLNSQNIENNFTKVHGQVRTNTKIVDELNMKTTELNESGFEVSRLEFERFLADFEKSIEGKNIVFLSGSIPKGIPQNIYQILIEKANSKGIKTILDADSVAFEHGIKARPYAVKPNLCELETYTGTCCFSEEIIVQKSLQMIEKGVQIVLVSMGEKGAIISSESESFLATPWECDVASTVGAGDAMTGLLGYGIGKGFSLEKMLRLCVSAGTITACKEGTTVCEFSEVFSMVDRVDIRKIR